MPSVSVINQYTKQLKTNALNCFTGALVELAARKAITLDEAVIFEQGHGFLFKSCLDEHGYPEFSFPVLNVGLSGCQAVGLSIDRFSISGEGWLETLELAIANYQGAIVWVNTSHLEYHEHYSKMPAYLHAILITKISKDQQVVEVYDPLIVTTERVSCISQVSISQLDMALHDIVKTEVHDHMGIAYVINCPSGKLLGYESFGCSLLNQSIKFFDNEEHYNAVLRYKEACSRFFVKEDQESTIAARRLFQHINVLYVMPSLLILNKTLRQLDIFHSMQKPYEELLHHWRALGLLALKYEATLSNSVQSRIYDRFTLISESERVFWKNIRDVLA
ncbi:BtrH N-terminal domain-containing protein [Chitinibacter sp. ZOR0017]|uniref:BtrH N-terminal domain-containing protein n=1 Tax=Chitinibacter sp. ZOR0017 TaxID=1339254 RepID=UPI00064651A8|nr:BtrH N-terminal domain-containing protein [Chitinibacter sp. ZOR0017]